MLRIRSYAVLILLALLAGLPRPSVVAQSDPTDVLFDESVVHDVRLAVSPRDWESLKENFRDNTRYAADLRWRDQVVRGIAIKSRGNGSRSGSKPGLKFDINYYNANQRFLGMKNLVLRNQTQDPSNLRELLSMKFFRRMNIPAPREAFARLFVNDIYIGLYTLVEDIDKDFLKRNLGEDEGYLFEYDFDEESRVPYAFEYLGSDPSKYVPLPFKPQTHESDPRAEVVERFLWTVNEASDAAWRQRMEEFLDLNAFMKHLGIENFLAEEDGITGDYGPNNFYFYRFTNRNMFMFLPWDKSNTFWDNPDYWIFRNINDGPQERRNRLVVRALGYPDLLDTYLNTLLACADSALEGAVATDEGPSNGWLEQEVSQKYDLIRSAARSDPVKPFSNDQFEEAITNLKTFARGRSDAVRRQVAERRR